MREVDQIWYKLIHGDTEMEVMVSVNGHDYSVADISLDRDIDEDEDADYLQNLAEDVAIEYGYKLKEDK